MNQICPNTNAAFDPLKEIARFVTEEGFVVPDGTWCDRFLDSRLINEATAAAHAKEAVRDYDHREVRYPLGILIALNFVPGVPLVARAAVLREVWLDHGINADNLNDVASFFHEVNQRDALLALMSSEEIRHLEALPDQVAVYRGQMFDDGAAMATSLSWTLSKKVANWYAAPVMGSLRGWVLSTHVPKNCVLALFLERGEQEVVIDPRAFSACSIKAERGTCDKFPYRLSMPRNVGGGK